MALAGFTATQVWTPKMPFTPRVRAPYTCTTGSGVVAGSGARPAWATVETRLVNAAKAIRLNNPARRRALMQSILGVVYDATTRQSTLRHEPYASLQRRKVVKLAIEEVRRPDF